VSKSSRKRVGAGSSTFRCEKNLGGNPARRKVTFTRARANPLQLQPGARA